MRLKLLAVLATFPLLLGLGPAAAAQPAVHYVALGDSYSAGVAAGDYDTASGACHRSRHAYPALWSAAHRPADFVSLACNAATVADVQGGQLPQLPAGSTLVTLTVGGNDLDFADAAAACLQPLALEGSCDRALDESDRLLRDELPTRLDGLYGAIRAAAPNARVVVTGYPHLLEGGGLCLFGTAAHRTRVNSLTDRLDDLIRAQAEQHGFRFADPRPPFAGHGVCTEQGAPWITGITFPLWESFHPTAQGQQFGYLPPVLSAIDA